MNLPTDGGTGQFLVGKKTTNLLPGGIVVIHRFIGPVGRRLCVLLDADVLAEDGGVGRWGRGKRRRGRRRRLRRLDIDDVHFAGSGLLQIHRPLEDVTDEQQRIADGRPHGNARGRRCRAAATAGSRRRR